MKANLLLPEAGAAAPAMIPAEPYFLLGGRLVRAVVSQRAGGLLIVVNMNPDQECNFNCAYCEVRRFQSRARCPINVRVMSEQLKHILHLMEPARFNTISAFARLPRDISKLRGVALSGDGEPTLCTKFLEVVREIVRIRRSAVFPWFKMILVTNSTGLEKTTVRNGLHFFTENDEVWTKLDCGTQRGMKQINKTEVPLQTVLRNIRKLGLRRPVIIQSMFCEIDGQAPTDEEIDQYVGRLEELKLAGVHIPLVQVYSTSREPADSRCRHLPLAHLSTIARKVRAQTGLKTEVY